MYIYSTGELAALFSTHALNIAKITSAKLFAINSNIL